MRNETKPKEVADFYQKMFNYFREEHSLVLTISEIDEIIWHAKQVIERYDKYNRVDKYCNCQDSPQRIEMSISRCARCNKFIEE